MVHDSNRIRRKATWKDDDNDEDNDDNDEDHDDNDGDHDDNEDDDANSVDEDDDANSVDEDENRRDKNFNVEVSDSFDHKVLVKIRAGVFYRTAGISAGLNSSSFCELIDKVIFKINRENQS